MCIRILLIFLLFYIYPAFAVEYRVIPGTSIRVNSAIPIAYDYASNEMIPWPSGGPGAAGVRESYNLTVPNGTRIPATITHTLPKGAVSRSAAGLLKFAGPVGAITNAISLGMLVWDASQQKWTVPAAGYDGANDGYQTSTYWTHVYIPNQKFQSGLLACQAYMGPIPGNNSPLPHYGEDFRYNSASQGDCKAKNGSWYQNWVSRYNCSDTSSKPVWCTSPPSTLPKVPATDAQIEQAVSDGIGSDSNKARAVAQAAQDNGYPPMADGQPQASGPANVQGPTSQTVSSGPAGQTTVNETINYNITYQGDTVTITEQTTATTTAPDGQTTTTTETKTPPAPGTGAAPGGPPPPPQKPLDICKEHPEIVACQTLGEAPPAPIIPESSVNVFLGADSVSGTCPPDMNIPLPMGLPAAPLSWGPICDGAEGIRPIVIGLAMLSAGLFLFRMTRG